MNCMYDKVNMNMNMNMPGMYSPMHSMGMCPIMNQCMMCPNFMQGMNQMQGMNTMVGMCPMMMQAQEYENPYVKIKMVKVEDIRD